MRPTCGIPLQEHKSSQFSADDTCLDQRENAGIKVGRQCDIAYPCWLAAGTQDRISMHDSGVRNSDNLLPKARARITKVLA